MTPAVDLPALLSASDRVLVECAVAEQLRRMPGITLHPTLFNTPLIYGDAEEKAALTGVYTEYLRTAVGAGLPLLLTAPTWRLDARRVEAAEVPETINGDAVRFLRGVVEGSTPLSPVAVGALIGPKEDCYRPDLAPEAGEAEDFHTPQIAELGATDANFLIAQTLPSVDEAQGIARALSASGKPYLISFCTGTDGNVLDGTPLTEAMGQIDATGLPAPPLGYFVNCTYPTYLTDHYAEGDLERLVGIQANGSAKDVTGLDGADATEGEPIATWAADMLRLRETHGVTALGGCCGTSVEHMRALLP